MVAPPPGLRVYRTVVDGSEYAVLVMPQEPEATSSPTIDVLTSAERDVVAMVIDGLPNEAIAAKRGTRIRTVANQLQSIYRKLGVGSRLELTVWARAHRVDQET